MIRKAIKLLRLSLLILLTLAAGLTARMWVNVYTMQRASGFQADVLAVGVPGLSNVLLTDDRWLPFLNEGWEKPRWMLTLPYWMAIAFLLAYPIIVVILSPSRRRRRRLKQGLCLKCGYNLTGNESGVCPECGTET